MGSGGPDPWCRSRTKPTRGDREHRRARNETRVEGFLSCSQVLGLGSGWRGRAGLWDEQSGQGAAVSQRKARQGVLPL